MRSLLIFALLTVVAASQTPDPGEKAAKYHAMLLKRPKPGAIFERFTSAWLEDQDIASLRAYLEARGGSAQATTADRLVLAFFLSQQSEHDAAIATFAKALEADPNNADAWFERARAEARVSRHEDSLKSLEHVKGATGGTAVEAAKLKAQMLARLGRTDESLETLKALAAAHLDNEDLQDEVIELQLDEGLDGEAMDALKALLDRTKDAYLRVMRRLRLGDILKRLDRRDDALAAYAQCLDDAAQDSWIEGEVLAQIEQTFRSKDDVVGLKEYLATLASKHAQRLSLGQLRARVLLSLNEGDDAIALHRELVQKHPGNAVLKEAFVDLLARLQKYEDAVTQCAELIAQRPQDKELRIHHATLLYQAKRPGEAMKALQPLIAEPATPEFEMLRVARLYESFEDPEEARKLYQRAVETYPESITAIDALASFLHSHGDKPRAISLWKKQGAAPAIRDEVLRAGRALSSRGEHAAALDMLSAREKEFSGEPVFLTQLLIAATGAQQPELAKGWALALLGMAKDGDALDEALRQVRPVFRDAKAAEEQIHLLRGKAALTLNERCLLAELLEQTGDSAAADKSLEGNENVLLRQQARLCLLRQDFEKAALTLEKAVAIEKELSVVEQLVSLWRSASNHEAALKWARAWQQLLPGSTRPWLAEATILQVQSKVEEAIKVLKAAARKFNDDVGVKTALASALTLNNQAADAQRIYQALYDDSEDIPAQLRWAGQLAETAQRRGALKELLDAFQERQQGNRTSISPWLAIAEIHRRTNNYEGRRTALMEASRLKPKDLDLLHQIAKTDEDQGDWRKAIETLTAAAALDKTNKTKQRIAEVHLRYGDEETGLRLAFELSGGSNTDPRDAEGMIVGLMTRSNWRGAMSVIDPILNQNSEDYRLRYLKMLCLIEDEKADAAISEAVTLMGARLEVLTPSKSKTITEPAPFQEQQLDPISEMIRDIRWSGSMALGYRQQLQQLAQNNRFFISSSGGQTFYFLPPQVRSVKPLVTAILVQLKVENQWSEAKITEVIQKLGAAGHPVPECVRWFETSSDRNQQIQVSLPEVEKHLDQEKLVQFWINQWNGSASIRSVPPSVFRQLISQGVNIPQALMSNGRTANIAGEDAPESKLLQRIYEHYQTKSPTTAAMAVLKLWQASPTNTAALDKAIVLASQVPVINTDALYAYLPAISRDGGQASDRTPEMRRLRDATITLIKRYIAAHPGESKAWLIQIPRLYLAMGDWTSFVTSLEETLAGMDRKTFRSSVYFGSNVAIQPVRLHQVMATIEAIPTDLLQSFAAGSNYNWNAKEPPKMDEAEAKGLGEAATKLKDPELRAIIAWQTGDKATFDAFVNKQKTEAKPKLWALLAKSMEIEATQHVEDAALLIKARSATTDREHLKWVNSALVHTVMMLMKSGKVEEAKPFLKEAESAVLALRRASATGQYYEMEQVGNAMEALGMKDEAERQKKLTAAAKLSQNRSYSTLNTSRAEPYQLLEDIKNGKTSTAVPLAVRGLKQFVASLATGNSSSSYQFDNWSQVAKSKASDDLWKQVTAGEATTPRAKLERAILADLFGKSEIAIPIYEEAIKAKPRDAFLRWQLAMALIVKGGDKRQEALDHLSAAAPQDLGNVAGLAFNYNSNLSVRQNLDLVAMIVDYISLKKSASKSGDLEWCSRAIDVLISASPYRNNPRLPNMLEAKPDLPENARALSDERMKLLQKACITVADIPYLAEHLLPAEFALAHHAKKDTSEIIKHAKRTLAELALSRNGSRSYYNQGEWEQGYSGSYSGKRIWTPMLPAMLLHDARRTATVASFEKDIVPLIRGVYGSDAGVDFAIQSKLHTCPEADFLKLAKDYETQVLRGNGGNSFKPTLVLRIWSDRKLTCDASEIVVRYLRSLASNGYSTDEDVLDAYLAGLNNLGSEWTITKLLGHITGSLLEKPETEWRELVTRNSRSGTPGYNKLRVLGDVTGRISRRDIPAWIETCAFLMRHGFSEHNEFTVEMTTSIKGEVPAKAADIVPVLASAGLLNDMRTFDPGTRQRRGERSFFERVMLALQEKEKTYAAALVEALIERQKNHRSFGAAMVIGRLAPIAPDMKLTLEPVVSDFVALPLERQTALVSVMKGVWGGFDQELKKPDMKSLLVFGETEKRRNQGAVTKWMNAKKITEVSEASYRAVNDIAALVASHLPDDPELAQKLLEKGLELIDESYARGVWDTVYHDGFNAQSELMNAVCSSFLAKMTKEKGSPSLAILPLIARVCLADRNRTALHPFFDSKAKLGELMLLFFERHDGYADPRKAIRELVSAVSREMGDADHPSLLMWFYAMEPMVPIWYRTVIRSEAYALADTDGPARGVAQELAAGFALNKHDERGLAFIRSRMTDPKLHPLYRAECAVLLIRSTPAIPLMSDMKLCLDSVIPQLLNDGPSTGQMWEKMILSFNLMPASIEWDELAQRFRGAWMKRAQHFSPQGRSNTKTLRPGAGPGLTVLELFARSAPEEEMKAYARKFGEEYRKYTSSRLVLARHNRIEQLKEIMSANDGVTLVTDSIAGLVYRAGNDDTGMEIMGKAISDPSLAALGRMQIAQVKDSAWKAPVKNRTQRITEETRRMLATKSLKPSAAAAMKPFIMESFDAIRVAAPVWLKEMKFGDEFRRALENSSSDERVARLEELLSLAAARIADDDKKPWMECLSVMAELKKEGRLSTRLIEDVAYRFAICGGKLLNTVVASECAWIGEIATALAALVPADAKVDPTHGLTQVWFVQSRLARSSAVYDAWRTSLPVKARNRLLPTAFTWVPYVLESARSIESEDGGALLLEMLGQDWVRTSLKDAGDLSYRGKMPRRLSNESLRRHTPELLKALPDNKALLLSLMNAWADQKDRKPLHEAVKAVHSQMKNERVKAYAKCIELEVSRN